MSEKNLKSVVGIIMLSMHIFAVILLTYYMLRSAFLFSQYTTLVAIISPIFGVYSMTYLRNLQNTSRRSERCRLLSLEYSVIVIVLCVVLCLSIAGVIYIKANNISNISFEETKTIIAICEIVFGGMASVLYFNIYEKK